MFDYSRVYIHNDSKISLLEEKTKQAILDIVSSMASITYIDEEKLDKINFILNETLLNIYKYEEDYRFMVAIDNIFNDIKMTIRIVGIDFDKDKLIDIFKRLDDGEITKGNLGLWNCRRISKSFEIKDIDHPIFKKEFIYVI